MDAGLVRGGGVGTSSVGSGSSTVRRNSIFTELTLKEGLLHKINTGLSGLETNIAFQLMRSRPVPTSEQALGVAPSPLPPPPPPHVSYRQAKDVDAYRAKQQQQQPQVQARYPTFSGDDPEGRPAGLGDRFSDRSIVKHVASYLRRRRWLWSFADPDSFGSGGASSGSVSGARGGFGVHRGLLAWSSAAEQMVNALARSRRADGFVIMELRKNEALMVKGIRIMLGVVPETDERGATTTTTIGGARNGDSGGERHGGVSEMGVTGASGGGCRGSARGGGRRELRAIRLLLQYRVFEVREGAATCARGRLLRFFCG